MRRKLLWMLLALAALGLVIALAVALLDAVEPAPPDPGQPIELPDGSVVRLDRWLDRWLEARPAAPVEPLRAEDRSPPGRGEPGGDAAGDPSVAAAAALYPGMPWGPVFKLAEYERQAGRSDQALALFQSIPDDDPDYAIARRRMARELLDRGEPAAAVFTVKQALAADPLAANGWQELVHVCGRAAGLPLD